MTSDGRRALHVAADLSIEVDGVPVQVRASGAAVHVVTGDLRRLLAGVRASADAATPGGSGRAEMRTMARTLAESGLTARLDGPSGRVATLGADVDSRSGAALLGTRHVRLHPAGVIGAGRTAAGVAAVLVLVGIVALRRRGSRGTRGRGPATSR